jgi:hypothetical protein
MDKVGFNASLPPQEIRFLKIIEDRNYLEKAK